MERKKILYMITKGNFGGAQRYVFDLATNLPSEKYEVVVACGEGDILKEKLGNANVRVIEIPGLIRNFNFFGDLTSFLNINKIIREEKPDILHLNSSKMGGLGALVGRIQGVKKIIFTGHGWAFNEDRNIISKIAISFLHWLTILLSHKTIAVSQKIADQIRQFPLVRGKVVQIYNGVPEISFYEKGVARKELAPDVKERVWIGTIAELHKNKGLDFLIKALAKSINRDVVCIIIGEGEERERLAKLISEVKLEEKVFLLGFKKDAAKYLKAFDIFSFTSRTEAFPYAPLEAGLASLPVVGSWAGGIPEIVTNEESGLLAKVGDISEISKNLNELIEDEELRKQLGRNLYETVYKKFSLPKMLEKTMGLYNK